MVAHNLPDMLKLVASAVARPDARYRGYVKVLNHAGLRVLEVNVLGSVETEACVLSEGDKAQLKDEAQLRRRQASPR